MIEKGFELMIAGMGVVMFFLILMVLVMYGSSAILKNFEKPEQLTADGGKGGADANVLAQVAVAIAAAKRKIG